MEIETTYRIWPRDLDFEKLFSAVEAFAYERKMERVSGRFTVERDEFETITAHSLEEFRSVFKSPIKFERLFTAQSFKKKDVSLGVEVSSRGHSLTITVKSNDPDLVTLGQNRFKVDFRLQKPPVPLADSLRATYPQPTIFLGRHFDEGAAATAGTLKQFLSLLSIEVVEGEAYSARPIPAKVEALIDGQELYLGLVTKNSEHDWITAEAAYARGKSKLIILVVEEGTSFNPTIIGRDFEQIRFPSGRIEQSFIKLLQEFRAIGLPIV